MTSPSIRVFGDNLTVEHNPCDFCGNTDFVPFWNRMRHGVGVPTVFCSCCALSQSQPRLTAESLRRLYEVHYHKLFGRKGVDSAYIQKSRNGAIPRVRLLSRFLEGDRSRVSVFEIGAGAGGFQQISKEQTNWDVSGIEPGKSSHTHCVDQGLNVQPCTVESMPVDTQYDAVVSFHVLECVASPSAFFRKAAQICRPDGILFIAVPNLAQPADGLSYFFQLPNIYNFTPTTLSNYMRRFGFSPIYCNDAKVLTIIARNTRLAEDTYVSTDLPLLSEALKMRQRRFRLSTIIPPVPGLNRLREVLRST